MRPFDLMQPTDPEGMSPAERCDEIASIFARGVLRLHGRVAGDRLEGVVDREVSRPPWTRRDRLLDGLSAIRALT